MDLFLGKITDRCTLLSKTTDLCEILQICYMHYTYMYNRLCSFCKHKQVSLNSDPSPLTQVISTDLKIEILIHRCIMQLYRPKCMPNSHQCCAYVTATISTHLFAAYKEGNLCFTCSWSQERVTSSAIPVPRPCETTKHA